MRVIVTGCFGFIGFNFIKSIQKNFPNDFEIIGIDNLNNKYSKINAQSYENSNFTFLEHDINEINDIDKKLINNTNLIINFAAESHVDTSIYNPKAFIHSNISGVQSLLNYCKENTSVRLIHLSTDEVYGSSKDKFFHEGSSANPSSPYSASKISADMLINSYCKTFGTNTNIIRPANNYGPHQQPEKLIPFSIAKLLNNEKIEIYGDGNNIRHWLHVNDTISGIMKIIENGLPNEIYNIGSGEYLSNNEVAQKLLEVSNSPTSLIEYVKDRPGHDFRYATSFEKLKKLGWKPTNFFESSINEIYNWYSSNTDWLFYDINNILKNREKRF